jgi:arylsulfatase A-like enzyme
MRFGSRHRRAARIAVVCIAFAVAACGSRAPRPNVLLLVMDTTRADRCSVTGYERPTTPRLDEFAKDGVVFDDLWSPANWTGPAHASLFTGASPLVHGFTGGSRGFLDLRRPVLAERFAAAGYDTACFSNNEFVAPEYGLTRGFARVVPMYHEALDYPTARQTHERAAQWAEDAAHAGRPFFLFVNDMEPHQPYTPLPDEERLFLRGDPSREEVMAARAVSSHETVAIDLGLAHLDARRRDILSDLYDAEIRTLDGEIGRLLDRLRADGLLDSTLVVIVGDHGELLGDHGLLGHSTSLYRQVLHVPLVLRHPAWFSGGRVVKDVVRLEDVAPTLLEVCGLAAIEGIDGLSLTHDLGGRIARGVQGEHSLMATRAATEFPNADTTALARGIRSIYDGAFHLVSYSDGRRELYDVARDPQETDDASGRAPADLARLEALLAPR